jgi:hypothetical protein
MDVMHIHRSKIKISVWNWRHRIFSQCGDGDGGDDSSGGGRNSGGCGSGRGNDGATRWWICRIGIMDLWGS